MTDRLKVLVDEILSMSLAEQRQLERLLASESAKYEVRDGDASYGKQPKETSSMKWVTLVLPDDLAREAQAAGLLAGKSIEELIRRELSGRSKKLLGLGTARRSLVRRGGRLVVEGLPGETPITDAELKDYLDKMEW